MPFDVDIEDARRLFPDYTFEQRLTHSAFKAAFRAVDPDGSLICMKIISPEFPTDRVQREIQAMLALNHPNIARLEKYSYTSDPTQSLHYMIESFVDGSDLTAELGTAWSLDRIKNVFVKLCSALDCVRSAELVHRDFKPSNIRLQSDDTPVVIDFGMARHLSKPDLTATVQGARLGTPRYFAPEQFQGTKSDIEHRTDLFALGIIMYYAATGIHPFDPESEMDIDELEVSICEGGDHLLRGEFLDLPAGLQILLSKLLSRSRADRPTRASQVEMLLSRLEA